MKVNHCKGKQNKSKGDIYRWKEVLQHSKWLLPNMRSSLVFPCDFSLVWDALVMKGGVVLLITHNVYN